MAEGRDFDGINGIYRIGEGMPGGGLVLGMEVALPWGGFHRKMD